MFNPNNTTSLKAFWNRLSTFYDFVPTNEKELIEAYWQQLFNGMEGLSYDLAQVTLAGYLDYAPGYIEDQYQEYDIIFSGDNKNVELETYDPPVADSASNASPSGDNIIYNYKITALDDIGETLSSSSLIIISGATSLSGNNNTISWNSVSGVASYNVYGRDQNIFNFITNISGLSFVDDGVLTPNTAITLPTSNTTIKSYLYPLPNNFEYLTIPTLSGVNTTNVLVEGTDYNIEKLHYIRFSGNASTYAYGEFADEREIFIAPQGLFLLPSLVNLYFKSFGGPNDPEGILNANAYTPYISGWLTGAFTNFEEKRYYAEHLKHLSQGLTTALSKGPSFKNLRNAFCLISGMPFSYEAGTIDSINTDANYSYVAITSGNTYQIPNPLTLAVEEGEVVERYQILASGVSLHDYISSSGVLEEVTAANPEQFYYTLGIQRSNRTYGLNHYQPFVDYYSDSILPAGLLINYFNLPARGSIWSGSPFYSGGSVATFSGIITEPENDIVVYTWSHVLPLTTWDGDPSLETTMDNPNAIQTTTTLTTPPVDRYYLYRLNVADSDNSPNFDIEQNVYGTYSFETWDQTEFMLGDCELRYIYLLGYYNDPSLIDPASIIVLLDGDEELTASTWKNQMGDLGTMNFEATGVTINSGGLNGHSFVEFDGVFGSNKGSGTLTTPSMPLDGGEE
jgi:hypothetical protein